MSFGSNTQAKNFGRGAKLQTEWVCLCKTVNKRYLAQCSMCGIRRNLAEEVQEDIRVGEIAQEC